MTSHLTIEGAWQVCADSATCTLPQVELELAAVHALPQEFVEALVEAFDPPSWAGQVFRSWSHDGFLHRDYGLPSQIYDDGSRTWHRNGRLHRVGDMPAVHINRANVAGEMRPQVYNRRQIDELEMTDRSYPASPTITLLGNREWWRNGLRHRDDDMPAVINDATGYIAWYRDGLPHRDGDLPAIIHPDGSKEWWEDGNEVIGCRNRWRWRRQALAEYPVDPQAYLL